MSVVESGFEPGQPHSRFCSSESCWRDQGIRLVLECVHLTHPCPCDCGTTQICGSCSVASANQERDRLLAFSSTRLLCFCRLFPHFTRERGLDLSQATGQLQVAQTELELCPTPHVPGGRCLRGCPSDSLLGQKDSRRASGGLCRQSGEGVSWPGAAGLPRSCPDPGVTLQVGGALRLVPGRGLSSSFVPSLPYLQHTYGVTVKTQSPSSGFTHLELVTLYKPIYNRVFPPWSKKKFPFFF